MCTWTLNLHMLCVFHICVYTYWYVFDIYMCTYSFRFFFRITNSGILKVSTYRVIHVGWPNQCGVWVQGKEWHCPRLFFLSFSAWDLFFLERMTKQCWRLWICLSVNGWLLRAAPALLQGDWLGMQVFTLDAWIWLGKSAKSFTRIFILIRSERPATAE